MCVWRGGRAGGASGSNSSVQQSSAAGVPSTCRTSRHCGARAAEVLGSKRLAHGAYPLTHTHHTHTHTLTCPRRYAAAGYPTPAANDCAAVSACPQGGVLQTPADWLATCFSDNVVVACGADLYYSVGGLLRQLSVAAYQASGQQPANFTDCRKASRASGWVCGWVVRACGWGGVGVRGVERGEGVGGDWPHAPLLPHRCNTPPPPSRPLLPPLRP